MERLKLKVAVYSMLIKDGQIFLSRRFNTGWMDGNYSLPSGHLDPHEMVIEALLRETAEEIGIELKEEDVTFVHTMHRKSMYIDFYFTVKNWKGEPKNLEPDKCDDLSWYPLDALPTNVVPSVRSAIENYQNNILFSEFQSEE